MSCIGNIPVYCAKCDKVIEAYKVGWFGQCTDCGDMTYGSKKAYEDCQKRKELIVKHSVGDLRDVEGGCEVWTGEKWVWLAPMDSATYNKMMFEYTNPEPEAGDNEPA